MIKPSQHFRYQKGKLCAESVPLEVIAKSVSTPTYVYSSRALLEPLKKLQKELKSIDHQIFFAVKANSNIAVLSLLADHGAGMDIVSGGELYRVSRVGVRKDRIVFSGIGKTEQEIRQALDHGIYSFNIESASELALIETTAKAMNRRAPIALRLNPNVDAKTHPYISTGLKKNKFGLEAREVFDLAKKYANSPHLRWKGISIHIGSQLLSLRPLNDAFSKVHPVFQKLSRILGHSLEFIDVGGGVGIQYAKAKSPDLGTYCKLILKHFGPRSPFKGEQKILLEPGRVIAGNAGVLLCRTLGRKSRGAKDFIIVDAAMNDLIRPSLYKSFHEILPVRRSSGLGKKSKADIVGPVCETADFLAQSRSFPKKVQRGDLMAVLSAGAYSFTMASNYNSRPRAAEVLVDGNRYRVIRPRETYKDLIRGEHV